MPTVQVRKFRDIGPVIKAVRESRAVRQEDLAKQLAFSRDYLIDLEKGSGGLGEFRWWLQHRCGLTGSRVARRGLLRGCGSRVAPPRTQGVALIT
jgi:HTH-type transcriptional regulator/antitoxin HipB